MEYQRLWNEKTSVEAFGDTLIDAWASEYAEAVTVDRDELIVVDPGNRFNYLFDLAGSLSGAVCPQAPRVVGVWGLSRPSGAQRDRSRMRGFPRPRRDHDDRGHLISLAAGGGYDINLVPMDANLNRGRSEEGRRFRDLERRSAAVPGSLFFCQPIYEDASDRPTQFEFGVQEGDTLRVDRVANPSAPSRAISMTTLRGATPFPLDPRIVDDCLDLAVMSDQLFLRARRASRGSLTSREWAVLAGTTGHIAESVAEVLLDGRGWEVLWHFEGPGRHGADLVFLAPGDRVIAVEVKGTLVPGRLPRPSRRDMAQMSAAWIDKADNPAMASLGMRSGDIYGGVVAINFADNIWRAVLTSDFTTLRPVTALGQLDDLAWMDRPVVTPPAP
jgi:hypothetical protein